MLHYVLEDLMVSMKPTKDIEPLKNIVNHCVDEEGHGSICHKHELKGQLSWTSTCLQRTCCAFSSSSLESIRVCPHGDHHKKIWNFFKPSKTIGSWGENSFKRVS